MNKRLKTNIAFVVALLCIVLVPYGIGKALYMVEVFKERFSPDASMNEINVALWCGGAVIAFITTFSVWGWWHILSMFYRFIDEKINRQ